MFIVNLIIKRVKHLYYIILYPSIFETIQDKKPVINEKKNTWTIFHKTTTTHKLISFTTYWKRYTIHNDNKMLRGIVNIHKDKTLRGKRIKFKIDFTIHSINPNKNEIKKNEDQFRDPSQTRENHNWGMYERTK